MPHHTARQALPALLLGSSLTLAACKAAPEASAEKPAAASPPRDGRRSTHSIVRLMAAPRPGCSSVEPAQGHARSGSLENRSGVGW